MRSALKGIVLGVILLVVFGEIATRAGWITTQLPRPAGTGAWLVARASGLLAYVALSLDVIVGLLVSSRSADRLVPRGQLIDLHGWLSPLALALVATHGSILLADAYVRFDILDVAVPFAAGWAIGVGVIAAYVMLVVHASFALRKRIGTAWWRRLHYLAFVAFVLVTLHAVAAGSDLGRAWFAAVYLVVVASVGALLAVRLRRVSARR